MCDLASFLSIASAMGDDKSMTIPPADVADSHRGVTNIPAEVTEARRAGKNATLNQQSSNRAEWYWQIDGSNKRIMHD